MTTDGPLLGRTLKGRFKIVARIGEGAMATVYRGQDLQRPDLAQIAIKVMHPHLAVDRTFTARFQREAQAASMVRHANSVAIYDIGEEGGVHFIAMEYCGGLDLKETLKAEKRLEAVRAARIVSTICDALHEAHQLGVIHRDLKPENVVVERDPATGADVVKVLDFGIAKLVDPDQTSRKEGDSEPPMTAMGVVVGTPAYMSPEQCRGRPLDGRSDLYTCGILLYQLVTGTLPFEGASPLETAGKQAFETPPPPSSHLPSIDRELEALILQTLAKDPNERPSSAAELRDRLRAWVARATGGVSFAAPAPGASSSASAPTAAPAAPLPMHAAAVTATVAQEPKGWGALGVVLIALSLVLGVGAGVAGYLLIDAPSAPAESTPDAAAD
jgi:serine/threonine protein kinase